LPASPSGSALRSALSAARPPRAAWRSRLAPRARPRTKFFRPNLP